MNVFCIPLYHDLNIIDIEYRIFFPNRKSLSRYAAILKRIFLFDYLRDCFFSSSFYFGINLNSIRCNVFFVNRKKYTGRNQLLLNCVPRDSRNIHAKWKLLLKSKANESREKVILDRWSMNFPLLRFVHSVCGNSEPIVDFNGEFNLWNFFSQAIRCINFCICNAKIKFIYHTSAW